MIVGTLILSGTKYKYGYNKSGKELFLFKPLSNKHSKHLVASSTKAKENQYVVIEFLKQDKSMKYPIGQITKIIGDTSDINNTYDAILLKHGLPLEQFKFNKSLIPSFSNFDPLTFFKDLPHKNILDNYVFSVDPENCEDIDDALSVIKNQDHYLVSIHIADVSYYFEQLKLPIPKRYSTIYAPHKNYSMIPDILANNICSLKPNQNRLAFTVIIKMSLDYKIIDYIFEKTIIQSKKAYEYDELQELLPNLHSSQPEKVLYDIGYHLSQDKESYDTHKMIEVFMVLANGLVGKYLYEKVDDKKKIIYRTHEKPVITTKTNNSDVNNILELLESSAAIYTNDSHDYYHGGLNITHYTHFTSPIRRYVDVYIHMLLNQVLSNNVTLDSPNCDAINEFNRNTKKAERECRKIELALMIEEDIQLEAYVLEINDNKATIYIPEYKLLTNVKLWDKQLTYLETLYDDSTLTLTIINKDTQEQVTITKLQLIQVKLTPAIYNDEIHKKISIHIPIITKCTMNQY